MAKKELAVQEDNVLITTVDELQAEVSAFVIASPEDMTRAVEFLSELNKTADRVEADKAKEMRPALDVVNALRARWKPIESKLAPAILAMRKKISAYQTEQKRIADEEADRIAARVAPGKGNLKAETASEKIAAIEKPEESVSTEAGQVKFRTDKVFEVEDLAKLPIEYHLANEVMIRAAMKAGTELPGVKYTTVETPINFR